METNQRIFGLDLIRVTAIIMILFAQCIWILPQGLNPVITQVASLFHYIGLEVFFVLSGFLLGNSVDKLIREGDNSISNLLKKRAMRILPLYYLVLLANFAIAFYIGYPVDQGWKYFLLLQNFAAPIPAFFSESWGLPIIVFAGIVFPAMLFALNAAFSPKNKSTLFLLVTLLLIGIFLANKCIYNCSALNIDVDQWYTDLKPLVIYRLDAVFIGVLFSWLLHNISFFTKARWLFAVGGVMGICFIFAGVGYFHLFIENHPFFWNVVYLPLASLSIAFFLPVLSEWKTSFANLPIQFLSSITYAVYMVHFGIVLQLMKLWVPISVRREFVFFIIAYLTITFLLGFLLNKCIQKLLGNRIL